MSINPMTLIPKHLPRLRLLDLIRGFALFGIFVVNVPFLANTIYEAERTYRAGSLDSYVSFLVATLFQFKFYLLFCFAFGYSFGIQLSDEPADSPKIGNFYRRLAGLFVFGCLHGVLFFVGDILTSYAVLGLALIPMRAWPARKLWLFALAALFSAILLYSAAMLAVTPQDFATSVLVREAAKAEYLASFPRAAAQRWRDLQVTLPFLLIANWLPALAMFACGLASAKMRLLENTSQLLHLSQRWAVPAFALGLAGNLFFAWATSSSTSSIVGFAAIALNPVFAVCLAFCYVYALAWLHHLRPSLLRPLETAGRLSLTLYFTQSVFAGFLFNGWGLGLLGQWGPAQLLLLALSWFAVQLVAATFYSIWFLHGPEEWLLRSWSRLRWQPFFRLKHGSVEAVSVGGKTSVGG